MIDDRTNKDLKLFPELDEPQVYIYIMRNELGKVKVGITKNIQSRYQSLNGSNGQGIKILNVYLSPATYVYVLEEIMHERMKKYRIPKTEWFYYEDDTSGQIMYDSAIELMEKLINSKSYVHSNDIRKHWNELRGGKGHECN